MNNNKKWAAIALLVVVAAGAWFLLVKLEKKNAANKAKPAPLVKAQKMDVDFSKTPQKFPADIPLEKNANITQNYNATTPEGVFQATRVFETSKSLADNMTLYTDFLNKNGWKISSTIDKPSLKSIIGKKGSETLLINITDNAVNHKKTVSITYSVDSRSTYTKPAATK